ncbi:tumor necrosis factor receptor superfamily member 21 precursor [Silurus meridionalis]|nr:tumor necrosis factor receptor superfamily member 21 precursor [Silurus meridionalis]
MLPPMAVFLLLVSTDASMDNGTTFEYDDPDTGNTLLCALCPPGTYVSLPCSSTQNTVCLPCPKEHFTQFWNFMPNCLFCSNICEGNLKVKHQCSATHNRVCECKKGHYWQDDFCVPHTECPPGQGAKVIGTIQRNTQCGKCPKGTFSAVTSSSAQCIKHTDCGNFYALLPGRRWHDRICSSCANLTDKGGLKVLQDILPGFFYHQNIKMRQLRRFVQLLNGKDSRRLLRALHTRTLLLHYITQWAGNAHKHQLNALPKMLLRSGLRRTAEKVQDMVKSIEERISVCQNIY